MKDSLHKCGAGWGVAKEGGEARKEVGELGHSTRQGEGPQAGRERRQS